jgi:hypothetical protein
MNTEEVAQKLKSYTENDSNIYKRRTKPVLKKLARQKRQHTYKISDAFDDFMYIAEGGAKNYGKQFGFDWKIFPEEVRRIVAQEWLDEFETEYPKGTYDSLK